MDGKRQSRSNDNEFDEEQFDQEEFDDMELLERLESLREDMEDLRVTTLAEVNQRITELHRKLDRK
ncbi:MAG TPA: hypothetical protein VFQ30_17645 [Ktedonobacteraceae bacterium]|nr:hypothetical protein [Ktedonobacteraceae bacterium]